MAEDAAKDNPQDQSPQDQTNTEETQDNLPANDVQVDDVGTLRKKLTITISRERIDAKYDEMFGELSSTAQIPGFRIGRAPKRLIEKRFGKDINQDVRNSIVGEALGDALDNSDLDTVGEPDIDLENIELPEDGPLTFELEVEVAPQFELPDCKGIKVEKSIIEITDEHIDSYIDELREGRVTFEDTDGPASEGDVVVAGAKITGEDIEEVDRPGLTLRVAPGQIEGLPLVDLGEALSGKSAGDVATVSITVPAAHPNEQWRDKKLEVAITISQVRRRIVPKLDDAFIESIGFGSIDEMREFVRTRMDYRLKADMQRAMQDQIRKYLLDNVEIDLPEGVINRHTTRLLQRHMVDLLYRGVPREKIDENLTQLQADASEQAKIDLKLQFILDKVAEQQKVEVSEAEINARIAQIAAMNNRRPERVRQELQRDGSLEQVGVNIREDKAIDQLLKQAEIVETKPEPAKAEAKESEKPAKKVKSAAKQSEDKAKPKAKKTAQKAAKKTKDKTD